MTDAHDNIIVLEDVTKRFGDVTAADRVSLGVRRGEFVTLLGPSGCGKTTLLRMIAGFEPPTSGRIFIGGRDMEGVPPAQRPVNTVFQKYALFPHLTVFGNVAFGLKLLRVPAGKDARGRAKTRRLRAAEIKEKTERALRVVGLEGMGSRMVGTLAGGQQQRVAIARAAVLQPEVLLLDEPLGALDLTMRLEMRHELKRMQRELGITFVYVTHDQEEALAMSDTVVVMSAGAVHQTGTPEDVDFRPADAFVFPARQVAVNVDKQIPVPSFQPISAPSATSFSGTTRERFPLSSSAARIIPSDRTPHRVTGFKLVTNTTFLPTISSGA